MIPPTLYKPFMPLAPMTCAQLHHLLPFIHSFAPERHDQGGGNLLYCFVDGLILSVYSRSGRVYFQGPGAAGLTAQEVARRIEAINEGRV
ncbi:hypothetical protein SFA35_18585 [Pseudomonas sp. HR96]|uniref:hypothetical protein n=1 Tax=Pseudomonas sp. HR96 TaxID=1027966 RepID=UPI002A7632AB|nr:hypothetical protein [Pseudomonas sp. HR96]WPO98627.1 hypothetical protein SFA35_18585 [Pseudomonas sp. HR96]